jgi:hypothetical protein
MNSDSVNLGSNPSSPATQNVDISGKTTPGHSGHPGQTAHIGRTIPGTVPRRIQRSRAKGWRMPPNTVYVGRGSIWGNPFVVGQPSGVFDGKDGRPLGLRDQVEILIPALTVEQAIEFYRNVLRGYIKPEMFPAGHAFRGRIYRHEPRYILRGKDLACWCALDQPCHADVLLELANTGATP